MVLRIDNRPKQTAPPEVDGLDFDDSFLAALDLGQTVDFSALVAVRKRVWRFRPERRTPSTRYTVRGIKRWPLRTPYTKIAADVAELTAEKPLAGCVLGIDETGVGKAVLEMLRGAKPDARIVPILITAGHQVTREGPGWHVPKKELVGTVNTLLQASRIEIPAEVPEANTLGKELLSFRAKITAAGNETAEADWRSRQHDDLVLALAIAVWLAERERRSESRPPAAVNMPGWR